MSENKLVDAYNKIITHLHEDIGDASRTLARALEGAKEKLSEVGGLTQEEINKVADYVKRDIEEVAHSLVKSDEDTNDDESLAEWLKFDIELIENFALDAFMSVADKTRIELAKLQQMAKLNSIYKAGEITGPGTLVCEQCGEELTFKTTSEISKCPKCGGLTFRRS